MGRQSRKGVENSKLSRGWLVKHFDLMRCNQWKLNKETNGK